MNNRNYEWQKGLLTKLLKKIIVCVQVLTCVVIFLSFEANSQDISLQSIASAPGKIILNFSLDDPNPDRRYTLRLYSSLDNYVQPLQEVSGNIGIDQRVGGNKQIIWEASKELETTFDDYISFEVRAFIYIPFIEMEDLSKYGGFKRGKPYTIKWTGGRPDNVLNFELYKANKKIGMPFRDVANTGSYDKMRLPKGIRPGDDYYFLIADQNNSDQQVKTGTFKVKAQIPLLLKIAVGLVVGSGAGYLASYLGNTNASNEIELPEGPK